MARREGREIRSGRVFLITTAGVIPEATWVLVR